MANSIDIKVPDLGDFSDVEVIEVLVKAGDRVSKEDGLITLETDKAAMDVPAEEEGEVEEISVSVGDKVSTGDVIGRLKTAAGADGGDDSGQVAGDADAPGAEAEGESPTAGEGKAGEEPGSDGDREKREEEPEDQGEEKSAGKQTVMVPDLGDFSDVEIIEVHVKPGDEIQLEDGLITLETDKAAMDVPSTVAGRVESVLVQTGDRVSEGSEIAVIEVTGGAETGEPAEPGDKPAETPPAAKTQPQEESRKKESAPKPAAKQDKPARKLPPIDEAGFARAHASPSVRKLARELGVDLASVRGSGEKDRILHEDVKAFVKEILTGGGAGAALPKVPSVDFSSFGETERQPLTRIQKIAGPRLQASWINLPHVTQHDLADITGLEEKRQELKASAKERGISLTVLAFIMRACVATLREYPRANASLAEDGENLVYKKYIHLGFAADTENGLMVPVIRDADKKDVYEIATELGELSKAAREGKLKANQMQGASFTISSLGGIGGTAFTPIVNAPEVAILGVSRSSMQPVWDGSEFRPRLMLPLSLSYDHRVIDGAYAVRFTTFLSETLSDVDALLEAIP
ncbi:MAG TPA: dihydrolipoyllysine-residue acetyltransferase [Woeseiaceae bacterium]|nr:dihydrolipoyllysine-residue acetyltransferase [Woeseiaceae bacterium]